MSRILAALLICAFFKGSFAQQEALARLDSLLANINSLTADVVQLIVESDGGILEESNIKMLLKKPNGFYWETITPYQELIVTNGIKLWNYQPDLEQVVIEDWDVSKSELAAQLLSGKTENLDSQYIIEELSDTNNDSQEFVLTPVDADSIYTQISINFITSELDLIYLNSRNGQQTVWRFDAIERNQILEDSLFDFQPPAGIEIIENIYVQ
ncbi:MAG: outer membrane lipoprotein chaperone LolA [Pseudomonadota bacterium]|mgnify:FL=1|nr:outer membrane lipoprotein chaperone LolA [Pseudomonadales bacterium]MEC7767620.1 outer membrane lipoprotein chaperone LolA [Pseudomonadota bacterium]MEC8949586.1 outer membrane lipoprotein chaperone LolA [Pseudomonadota bacterium]MEE3238673.1 outer membrane lipoprotein chaperone LolA [Pseudomonadota bacterium]HAI15025.1 outer membrane lipoprotein carrier protein LolA [Gammaproteobacteria bacterium]|tara:strand:+ start:156 stop:791 length:636 start_codon:yes stop_codon:yes gene_type:complete